MYKVLLCDADGTLFDFHGGEKLAIKETFAQFNLPTDKEFISLYHQANKEQWLRLEQGDITLEELKVLRFSTFLHRAGLMGDAKAMSEVFISNLAKQAILLPGALEFVKDISAVMPIYLVTNGISKVQRGRFTDCAISPYITDMIISEEIGQPKPDPAILYVAMRKEGLTDVRDAIVFGDSISADIGAANRAGMDSLLLWSEANPLPVNHGAKWVVHEYEEAKNKILKKE